MTLVPGTKFGPYEIVAPLGAGGMGEVYRAKDTRLGREVAVKVLPQHLSADPEVRARFEREARAVAALNHPHICVLHDVGSEGGTDYLVMELVEGETLAQRLARGPLPAADVLRLGAQIADALDRAHRAGVVHRDLKPGNVMVTRAGAKLMDFGLARATGLAPAGGSSLSGLTQTPTAAAPLTAEGTIVGTFQYMAPEQLEGKEADARTDLWALGCVLHEMATGRRAFEGGSQASLIAAIMHVAPPPLSQLVPLAPPALERVVSACLAKDPNDRIQSAHDVKLQLGWMSEAGASSAVAAAPARPAARRGSGATLAWVFAVLGIAAAVAAWWWTGTRREPATVTELSVPLDLQPGDFRTTVRLSPDGRRVVLMARAGSGAVALYLWSLDAPDPRMVPGSELLVYPVWSPDGRSLACWSPDTRTIQRISAEGGGATRLAESNDPRGLDWGAKDWIVYAPAPSGPLYKVRGSGGAAEPATELDAARHEGSHRFPSFLPDGEHFLFAALPRGANGYAIRVGSLKSKASKLVMEAGSAAVWVAPGWLVFVEDRNLVAQRFDLRGLRVTGRKFVLGAAPIETDYDAETPISAGAGGRFVFVSRPRSDGRLVWVDRRGAVLDTLPVAPGAWFLHSISPDGSTLLAANESGLHQVDLERGVSTRLLEHVDPSERGIWSPDGRRIVAVSREQGREVLRVLVPGGGVTRDSVPGEPALFYDPQGFTPDGRALLVALLGRTRPGADTRASWDLWTFPLAGGEARPWAASHDFERFAQFSPDGRWVLYWRRSDAGQQLLLDSYPEPGHRISVATTPGGGPNFLAFGWVRDGSAIYYQNADREIVRVAVTRDGDGLRPGRPEAMFRLPREAISVVSADGERFLLTCDPTSVVPASVRLVTHWEGLLRK